MTLNPGLHRLAVALLPLLFLLPFLGSTPLFDVDEGAFSEATREMLARGDYLSTWLNGTPRFDKPILIYWLQALSVSIFGINEWGFRLPSALAASAWCVVVARFARDNFGEEAGQMAGIVTLTSLGIQLIGRAATADALLNLLLALTMVDLWRHIAGTHPNAGRRVALWVGLGFLTKGPIALLVPGAPLLLWCLSRRDFGPVLTLINKPANWLILLGVALPWYAIALYIHGDAFIQGFFMRHNVERFSTPLEGHRGSLFYYIALLPLLTLPWLPWLWRAISRFQPSWQQALPRFLWLWSAFVLVFFSLSGTKLPHYLLYGCTPLFILIAAEHGRDPGRLAIVPPLLLLVVYAMAPSLIGHIDTGDNSFYAAQLARLPGALADSYLPAAAICLLTAALIGLSRKIGTWRRVAVVALIGNIFLSAWLAPLLGELLQGPIRRAALTAKSYGEPVVQWKTHWPSFSVYLQAETLVRAPLPGQLTLMRTDRLPPTGDYDPIFREGGVALIRPHAHAIPQDSH